MPTAPLNREAIKATWTAQNPMLVKALSANGSLAKRLDEAHQMASLVMGDAIERGLSPEQSRELAQEAIGLVATTVSRRETAQRTEGEARPVAPLCARFPLRRLGVRVLS